MNWIKRILPNRTIPAGDPKAWQLWRWMSIVQDEELYLLRLYILRSPWFGVMLHWIERPDNDRDALHDHPWEFWRFIVRGGYTEEVAFAAPYGRAPDHDKPYELLPSKLVTHKRFSFNKFPTGAYHRISSVKPKTISLVITGPKINSWGFFVPGKGKIGWRDYTNGAR